MFRPNKPYKPGREVATREFAFLDLVEVLDKLGCISKDTYANATFNEDYESENFN